MSLFDAMRTGISGMNAQSTRISVVAENVSNSNTTGYKKASVEFETVLGNSTVNSYTSGSVASHMRYDLTHQGSIQSTTAVTDLAIQGDGFFVVTNSDGAPLLTRAGSFVPDASGRLVNAAGYYLMGYDLAPNGRVGANVDTLSVVTMPQETLAASPTTSGSISANLPSQASVVAAAQLPSANAAGATWSARTSLIAHDNLGAPVTLDIYFTKTGANTWEAAIFDRAGATNGGFPYSSGPLSTVQLAFNPANGKLTTPVTATLAIPNGQSASLDLSGLTQLATQFNVLEAQMNGSAPLRPSTVEIGKDGTVAMIYQDGTRISSYRIPLASVVSPNQLTPVAGNAYSESIESGTIVLGAANNAGLGKIMSASLENSTVDIASELTTMIEAQRGYTANSKVFQTSSELLDVLTRI